MRSNATSPAALPTMGFSPSLGVPTLVPEKPVKLFNVSSLAPLKVASPLPPPDFRGDVSFLSKMVTASRHVIFFPWCTRTWEMKINNLVSAIKWQRANDVLLDSRKHQQSFSSY